MTFVSTFHQKFQSAERKINIPLLSSERGIRFRSSMFYIMTTVALVIFTDIFLYGVVVPVIPFAFKEQLGYDGPMETMVSKNLAIYSGGLIFGSITFGYAADYIPQRRWLLIIGIVIAIISVAMEYVAHTVDVFLGARFLQGISAAVQWTIAMALISDTAIAVNPPGADISDQVSGLFGVCGSAMTIALMAGPCIGGAALQRAGYDMVWIVCFIVLGVDLILCIFLIEKRCLPEKLAKFGIEEHITLPEESLEAQLAGHPPHDGATPITTTTTKQAEPHQESPKGFVAKVKSIKMPVMIKLLGYPRIANALWQTVAVGWAMCSIDSNMVTHLADIWNWGPLNSGLMFICIAIPNMLESPIGHYTTKWGICKWTASAGFIAAGVFMLLLRLPTGDSVQQKVLFGAFLSLFAFAAAFVFPIMTGELFTVASKAEKKNPGVFGPGKGVGSLYGLFNIAFSFGALIGPLESSAVMESQGWASATMSLSIVLFVTTIPTLLFTNGTIWKKKGVNKQQNDEENGGEQKTDASQECRAARSDFSDGSASPVSTHTPNA